MREVLRYSEGGPTVRVKLRLVEDLANNGKYRILDEARRRNGIRGGSTVSKWIKQYGREDMLPKRIKVETMNEINELRAAREDTGTGSGPGRTRTWTIALRAPSWISPASGWGRARRS